MALIAVVCAVIGTVTTVALSEHLYDQLDKSVSEVLGRAAGKGPGYAPPNASQRQPEGAIDLNKKPSGPPDLEEFATKGPQQMIGTIAAKVEGESAAEGMYSKASTSDNGVTDATPYSLSKTQLNELNAVSKDGDAHTVTITGLGDYRVMYRSGDNGDYYVALPTTEVTNTVPVD